MGDLRHTFASSALALGESLPMIGTPRSHPGSDYRLLCARGERIREGVWFRGGRQHWYAYRFAIIPSPFSNFVISGFVFSYYLRRIRFPNCANHLTSATSTLLLHSFLRTLPSASLIALVNLPTVVEGRPCGSISSSRRRRSTSPRSSASRTRITISSQSGTLPPAPSYSRP